MAVTAAALGDTLESVVGRNYLISDPLRLTSYAVDGSVPRWVAAPGHVEEVGALLRLAFDERLAVVPRGTGERMELGNLPGRVDLVLDCSRLSAEVAYEPDDLTITVRAGLSLEALSARLAPRRQFLPLDPLVGSSRSLGGVVATNDSGPLRLRYGTARDLLLGVRFVQADGTVTFGGARVVKSVTGYDIPKLLVGSLGTLGILVELTLRLHPMVEAEAHWLVSFPSAERAGAFLDGIVDSALQPSRLELLNGEALIGLALPHAPAAVAVTVGSVPSAVRSQGEALLTLAARDGGEVRALPDGGLWRRLGRLLAGALLVKVVTAPALTAEMLSSVDELARGLGLRARVLAEAGDGVLHVALTGDLSPEQWERSVILPLRDWVGPEGGSVVVEAAPQPLKARLDVWGPIEPGVLAVMRRLKAKFDPRGILNPGRFVDRM